MTEISTKFSCFWCRLITLNVNATHNFEARVSRVLRHKERSKPYNFGFGYKSIGRDVVQPQNHETTHFEWTRLNPQFAAEHSVGSGRSQKTFDRALQGLSIHMNE